jgi:hypothetical protein
MSRELVLCILVAVYDKIQTQSNDVALFGNIDPSSKTILGEEENRRSKSYALVTGPNSAVPAAISKMKMDFA